MNEVLLLTGGPGHPADASEASLDALFDGLGLRVDPCTEVEPGVGRLDPTRHALLVVNVLRHATRPGEERPELTLSAGARAAIAGWHEEGHPILSLHAGIISFDDWSWWAAALGGRWVWERSHHPPLGTVHVRRADDSDGFSVVDECYQGLEIAPDVEVVARSCEGHPLAWVRTTGPGAVGVDLLGHDARSLDDPGHRRLLTGIVRRLLEEGP